MQTMGYCSVLEVTPTSEEWIPAYPGTANRLVVQHGGKYLARTASHARHQAAGGRNRRLPLPMK